MDLVAGWTATYKTHIERCQYIVRKLFLRLVNELGVLHQEEDRQEQFPPRTSCILVTSWRLYLFTKSFEDNIKLGSLEISNSHVKLEI